MNFHTFTFCQGFGPIFHPFEVTQSVARETVLGSDLLGSEWPHAKDLVRYIAIQGARD